MLFSKNSGNFFPDPFEKNTSQHPQHCPILRATLKDHSTFSIRRRIKRVIFNIAHFCALSNPFRKFFRFFFRSQARPSPTLKFAFQINFEENTGSQENRHHIKYTRNPPLSSRKLKISQKNPPNRPETAVRLNTPPHSNLKHLHPLPSNPARARVVRNANRREVGEPPIQSFVFMDF